MNLLNKLTIKNLKLNKKRSIVTIIGIILSVGLITALSGLYSSLQDSSIKYEILEKGNYHVSLKKVSKEDISTIKNNTKIEEISILDEIGYAYLEKSQNEYKPYAYILAYDDNALKNLSGILLDGRLPENDREIVIPEHLETNGKVKLNIGDKITLSIGDRVSDGYQLNQNNPYTEDQKEEIINTKEKTYKIVGVVTRPSSAIEDHSAPGYTFITHLDKKLIKDEADIYILIKEKNVKDYLKITANILGINENIFVKYHNLDSKPTDKDIQEYDKESENVKYELGSLNEYLIILQTNPFKLLGSDGLVYVVGIAALIIVVTSVFCIKNSFDISITEKIKQYGMLKSIGATKKQIRKNVLFEGLILGIIGIPLGILLGALATYLLILITNILLKDTIASGFKLIFSLSIIPIIISVILGLITIYASAINSARKASKVPAIESIRNSANIKINSKKIKSPKIIDKLFGIGGVISYKNLKRNKKRYRTTIVSLTISIATFIGLFYFTSLMSRSVKEQFSHYDYNYSYTIDNYEEHINLIEKTINLDNIEKYSLVRDTNIFLLNPKYNDLYLEDREELKDDKQIPLNIVVVGNEEYQRYLKKLNLNPKDTFNKAILIDDITIYKEIEGEEKLKEIKTTKFSYKKNDIITINTNPGTNEKNIDIEIAKVTTEFPMGTKTHNASLIVNDEFFKMHNIASSDITVYFSSKNTTKLQSEIELILKDIKYEYRNINDDKREQDNIFLLLGIFMYGFIAVIILIGITNIFNTITTSVELRKQEFAVLKSIGMTSKEFNKMINLESIFIGTKSLFYGTIIGSLLTIIIHKADGINKYNYPFLATLICIIVVLLLISGLMKYSVNKINKQNIIETIRNENI